MQFIRENYKIILEALGLINIVFTFLGLITPSNKQKTLLGKIGRVFDRIGVNIKGK